MRTLPPSVTSSPNDSWAHARGPTSHAHANIACIIHFIEASSQNRTAWNPGAARSSFSYTSAIAVGKRLEDRGFHRRNPTSGSSRGRRRDLRLTRSWQQPCPIPGLVESADARRAAGRAGRRPIAPGRSVAEREYPVARTHLARNVDTDSTVGQSHAVSVTPPGVGDLCGEGVDEIQRIEDLLQFPLSKADIGKTGPGRAVAI